MSMKTKSFANNEINSVTLKNVLFVHELETNLMSVKKATKNECKVVYKVNKREFTYYVKSCLEEVVTNNLYDVPTEKLEFGNSAQITSLCKNKDRIDLWHIRLGHRDPNAIN